MLNITPFRSLYLQESSLFTSVLYDASSFLDETTRWRHQPSASFYMLLAIAENQGKVNIKANVWCPELRPVIMQLMILSRKKRTETNAQSCTIYSVTMEQTLKVRK